ncbi:MAG: hypothetical protein A2Y12_08770 [Planctomycetes bacterium GWF2_42_9]|nr:MAG: hypothetical protein A2Y12_08770 [Planctomycetes bacterium GWF2_42_9]HAL45490.1 hypothetical protein [Phycisphaerales bacterium]
MNDKKHKIAESIEKLTRIVNDCGYMQAYKSDTGAIIYREAHNALSYLFRSFICTTCQGSGEVVDDVWCYHLPHPTKQCDDCGGTGIKKDILDRLEAEEITGRGNTFEVCGVEYSIPIENKTIGTDTDKSGKDAQNENR